MILPIPTELSSIVAFHMCTFQLGVPAMKFQIYNCKERCIKGLWTREWIASRSGLGTWQSVTWIWGTFPFFCPPWGTRRWCSASFARRTRSRPQSGPIAAACHRTRGSPANRSIPPSWCERRERRRWGRVRTARHLDFISVYNSHLPSGTGSWNVAIFILGRISDRPIGGMRSANWLVTGVVLRRATLASYLARLTLTTRHVFNIECTELAGGLLGS